MNAWRKSLAGLVLAVLPVVAIACSDDDAATDPALTNPNANAGVGEADAVTNGYLREPAPQVGDISLPDVTNQNKPFDLTAGPDGLLLVFFGFTNCPDICPTTMSDIGQTLNRLDPADAERIDVAMVTIDPERDTATLAEYVQGFVPDGHGLATKNQNRLRAAADAFGVSYEVQKTADGEFDVGHSNQLFGVDDTGAMVITWPFDTGAEGIAPDIERLLNGDV